MSERRQTNVDNEGNVLYLDQALLDRKEVGFPPYKNRPDGLGIYNWILKNILFMSKKRWPLALRLYHLFVKYSVWMKKGGWKARLYKKAIKLYPDLERPTGTVVLPLNVDITSKSEKTVVPLDIIRESLKQVDYIAGMDRCLCRDANNRIHINQERCVGCGICRSRCQHDVISIKQTMPMRKDLHEYFLKEYNLDIKLGNQ